MATEISALAFASPRPLAEVVGRQPFPRTLASGPGFHHGYAVSSDPLAVLDEFRTMVRAFHRAAEAGAGGPSFCFRGLGNRTYDLLDDGTGRYRAAPGGGAQSPGLLCMMPPSTKIVVAVM